MSIISQLKRKRLALFLCGFWLISATAPSLLTVSYAQKKQSPEQELFFVAQKAFDDGFYDVAIRYINQFLQKFPSTDRYAEARLLLGECYFFKNHYLKAFEIFESLMSEPKIRDATLYWLGETYFKGSDYKKTQEYYSKIITDYPKSDYVPQAYYSMGWSLFNQGKYEQAIKYFKQLPQNYASNDLTEDALFKIGQAYFNMSDYQSAADTFLQYLNTFPKSGRTGKASFFIGESYYYLNEFLEANIYYAKSAELSNDPQTSFLSKLGMGWIYLKLKKYDMAERNLTEAESILKKNDLSAEDLLLAKGALYTETKRYQDALETYNTFLTDYADSTRVTDAILGKANALYLLQNYDKAIKTYEQLVSPTQKLQVNQDLKEKAYYGIAWSQLKKGDTESAIATFQTIIDQSSSDVVKASALSQIGDAYQESQQLSRALMTYDRILKEHPDSLYADYAQFQQGITFLKMGDFDAAKRSLQTLKSNFPSSHYLKEADYYLGFAYFQNQEWADAIRYITEFLKSNMHEEMFDEQAKYILALSYFHKKDFTKAISLFRDIAANVKNQPSVQQTSEIFIGKCLNEMGKTADAVKQFRRIIQDYPLSQAHQDALIWLGEYYLTQENFSSAITAFHAFIEKFPGSEKIYNVYYELGQSYLGLEQFDNALNAFQQVNDQADPEILAKTKLAIADIFTMEMGTQKGLSVYQQVADQVPDYQRDALSKIAQIYEQADRPQDAIQTYEKALKKDRGASSISNAELLFHIADNYEILNNPDKAVEEYLRIPYLSQQETPWTVKAYLRIARIFENQEKWDEAEITYTKILKLNIEESKYAQERIDWINKHIQN